MNKQLLALFLTVSAFLPSVAFADIAPSVSTIGSISPPKESAIQMSREVVTFTVPSKIIPYTTDTSAPTMPALATFWMKNPTGKAMTQQVLFPVTFSVGVSGEVKQYAKNVRVTVNGKRVALKETTGAYNTYTNGGVMKTEQRSNGYSFVMRIPAKKTVTVVVRFDAPVGYNYYNEQEPTVDYLLASGAGWGGPIEKATIQFVYPMKARKQWVRQIESAPTSTAQTLTGRAVSFLYTNFEPKENDKPHYVFLTPVQAKVDPAGAPVTTKYPGCDDKHPENCP